MDLSAWRGTLLHWLFPLTCVHCREDLPKGDAEPLCLACRRTLSWLEPPFCRVCAQPTSRALGLCRRCQDGPGACAAIRAVFLYKEAAPSLVHAFKYSGRRSAARAAGDWMGLAMARFPEFGRPDALVPVPLHWRRERERGYNQALLIAQSLSARIGVPVEELLERRKPTRPLWSLGRRERGESLRDAFTLHGPSGGAAGRRLLIVDDVCTSAATLKACAQVLRRAGAGWVGGYALARQAGTG